MGVYRDFEAGIAIRLDEVRRQTTSVRRRIAMAQEQLESGRQTLDTRAGATGLATAMERSPGYDLWRGKFRFDARAFWLAAIVTAASIVGCWRS